MRLFVTGPLDRLLVTDAPGWRSYKGDQLSAPPITEALAERRAEADLRSVYTAVMAPFKGETCPVRSIRRVTPEPDTNGAVAVAVELADRTEYVISALDDEPRTYGPVRMAGRFGMASVGGDGSLLCAYLLDGTELSCGDRTVTLGRARVARGIVSVDGRTVELEQPLDGEGPPAGAYLLTGGTGFETEAVQGTRLTVRDYPFVGGEELTIPSSVWHAW